MRSELTVWATLQVPGFHHWPDAPEHRAYLRHDHRHLFGLRAEVGVDHHDRDVEVHDLQDEVLRWWRTHPAQVGGARQCGPSSCERLAQQLADHLARAGHQVRRVEVSEDGECGATLTVPVTGQEQEG